MDLLLSLQLKSQQSTSMDFQNYYELDNGIFFFIQFYCNFIFLEDATKHNTSPVWSDDAHYPL